MRADDHEAVLLAVEPGPQVARLVDLDLDRQLVQARAQEVARASPLVGPADAPRAVRPAGEVGQLAQVREQAVGVHRGDRGGCASDRGVKRPWPGWVRISPRS